MKFEKRSQELPKPRTHFKAPREKLITYVVDLLCSIQERRQAKAEENEGAGSKAEIKLRACAKMLWRAFQLAFRVYTFAGGQDDRAEKLTRELAHEIETDPEHQ